MGEDEGAAIGQTGGRNLHDLAAVHLTDDAADQHLLRSVAVLHEGGVLLQKVGELVGAEADTALVRHVLVAQGLHAVQEHLIGIALGDRGRGVVAALGGLGGQGLEDIGVELRHDDLVDLAAQGLTSVHPICYRAGFLSRTSYSFL